MAYALSVVGAMFRWLISNATMLANPFAGIKVRGASRSNRWPSPGSSAKANGRVIKRSPKALEWGHGWQAPAAAYASCWTSPTPRACASGELVGATLGQIETDAHGDRWLHLVGKGSKGRQGGAAATGLCGAVRYLMQRKLPVTPARWDPLAPLIGSLDQERYSGHHRDAAVECDATLFLQGRRSH